MNKSSFSELLCRRYPSLCINRSSVDSAGNIIIACYSGGGKLLICGNGGSSSDADHMTGELMKCFESQRPLQNDIRNRLEDIDPSRGRYLGQKLEEGLPAISLSAHIALSTAICNDIDPDLVFAQQVNALGKEGDVLIGLTTSGNSRNIIDAFITAKALNIKTIGITGKTGGKLKQFCDILINVPEERTALVQELHLPVLHTLCLIVENHFFGQHKS